MRKKKVDAVKIALLKQWDEVCEPFRQAKRMIEDEKARYEEELKRIKRENTIIRTSSGYSRVSRRGGDRNV